MDLASIEYGTTTKKAETDAEWVWTELGREQTPSQYTSPHDDRIAVENGLN
jgi:hypothetical protein